MIAARLLLALVQAAQPACDGTDEDCACHLPLGPHVDADGVASEVECVECAGHRWHMLPYCVLCGHRFGEPRKGRICCVCLGELAKHAKATTH